MLSIHNFGKEDIQMNVDPHKIFSFQLFKSLSSLFYSNFENVQLQNHPHCKIMVHSSAAGDTPTHSEVKPTALLNVILLHCNITHHQYDLKQEPLQFHSLSLFTFKSTFD
jgi:hypothetical protein